MAHTISAGVGERMQYLAHNYNDTTIRFILQYPGLLDSKTLCAATKAVVGSVDVLHASFLANFRSAHWQVNKDYAVSDYFALIDCDGDPLKPAKSLALQSIAHGAKCQLHVTQINGSWNTAVLVRISHLVVDGSDGIYLMGKLAESYRLIEQTENTERLTVKDGSRSAMNAYNELSKKELASLLKSPFHGVKTEYPFTTPTDHALPRMLHCTIPADLLAAARQKAKAQGATVNDLLLTACYRSFAKAVDRQGKMSISSMMDLRQHCKDGVSEGLSNMSGGLSTTLEVSEEHSFSDDLQSIATQTTQAKSDPLAGLSGIPALHAATKAFPMWLLLRAADIVYSSMSLSLTNLGNIPLTPLSMGDLTPNKGIFGGPLKRKPSVQVCAASFDGTAELTILGDFTDEDLDSLQHFLYGMRQELASYGEEV
ncbi:MAG: hypothetical protein IKC24_05625 [Oscillospiraceae bacterium]|nr:hypothetical protein [Oscillospiraceae bacterium]